MLYSHDTTVVKEASMGRLRIKEVAEDQGLDIAKLSRRADLAYRTVWQLWNEPDRDVTIGTLQKLADALGVSLHVLIESAEPEQATRGAASK